MRCTTNWAMQPCSQLKPSFVPVESEQWEQCRVASAFAVYVAFLCVAVHMIYTEINKGIHKETNKVVTLDISKSQTFGISK